MSTWILLGLILCNLVWSANPMMGKFILEDFSPSQAALLKFGSAWIALFLIYPFLKLVELRRERAIAPISRRDFLALAGLGSLSFTMTPLFQMAGLNATRATDTSLIIGMEPIIAIVLAAIFLKERLRAGQVLALVITFSGFFLLSGVKSSDFDSLLSAHLLGNLLVLISLMGDASYSIVGRKYALRYSAFRIFGIALTSGVILLFIATSFMGEWPSLQQFSIRSFTGMIWMGPLGTTLSYMFWVVALRSASVATAALTLFIQPIFGAWLGNVFLGETLGVWQFLGAALILTGVFVHTGVELSKQR